MLNIFFLLVLALIYTFQSLFAKMYSDRYTGEAKFSSPVFSVIYGVVVAIITLAMNGFVYRPSLLTFLMGLANAAVLFIYNYALIEGSRRGSYSFVMICNLSGGLLVPMFVLSIVGLERLSLPNWIGLVLMLSAFVLLNLKEEKQEKPKKFFYLWILILGLVNGAYGTLLSLQTSALNGGERSEMLVTTFLFGGIVSAIYFLITARKKFLTAFRIKPKALIFALISCVAATVAANLVMYFYSIMSDTVVNATNQGGILIFSVLESMILFKEKMNWKQVIGAAVCVVAIILLNL